jgi:hypothetical protein
MEQRAYKRLETDEEFLKRVQERHPWYFPSPGYSKGEMLSVDVWETFRVQRKIVEVFP